MSGGADASFDLVAICPPYVLGPIIHEAATPESLNVCELHTGTRLTSAAANWYGYMTGQKSPEEATGPAGILCDVRDVAICHVKALLLPEAGGQRLGIATSEPNVYWPDFRNVQHASVARPCPRGIGRAPDDGVSGSSARTTRSAGAADQLV